MLSIDWVRKLKNLGNKSVSQIVEALLFRGIELPELPDSEQGAMRFCEVDAIRWLEIKP
ncbi:MAG: hypothetical protein HWQ38_03245, partial [Nostoc sp. NMS7]|nr:hypothetical protein [Nostoc sp. NMS7]